MCAFIAIDVTILNCTNFLVLTYITKWEKVAGRVAINPSLTLDIYYATFYIPTLSYDNLNNKSVTMGLSQHVGIDMKMPLLLCFHVKKLVV